MFDRLFGRSKNKTAGNAPDIPFGRYSDNNKPLSKVNRWTAAETLFKEKKYAESIDAFFDYLRDDSVHNVVYGRSKSEGKFELYQGSKIVRGSFNNEHVKAEVTLARMPQTSVPVMRRLLEMNFNLYYSRFAMEDDRLCMSFDTDIETASPNKLYYGLKELSTKGDKQDDLLVQDFAVLESADNEHISVIPDSEKEIKFNFLQKWIKETLDLIETLEAEKFSGGIAYMLLALIYKIDYLVSPEGKVLQQLEKISAIYFKKEERAVNEKNRDMIDEFKVIQLMSKSDIFPSLFRSKFTFAIVAPQQYKLVAESIRGANQNLSWYKDNNYPFIAMQIAEYGISFCQYSYSLPRVITELVHLYMMVNYSDYFAELGFKRFYEPAMNEFEIEKIGDRIREVVGQWKEKYPQMNFRVSQLRFDSLVNFDYSFTTEMELLNTDLK